MSHLIINADDLGYSPAVNRAIADLHRAGLVTSTSLLVNLPYSEDGVATALSLPRLSVGVHLNLSKGRPLSPAEYLPSLVDENGYFWPTQVLYRRAILGQVNWFEAAVELEAQIEWAMARGLHLDNLDSHVHFHMLPAARQLTMTLARRYHVAAWRSPNVLSTLMPVRLWTDLLATPPKSSTLLTPNYLISLHQWGERLLSDPRVTRLLTKPGVVTELVVHPGYADDPALPLPDQLPPERRQAEFDLLTSDAFANWLRTLKLKLISFADLGEERG